MFTLILFDSTRIELSEEEKDIIERAIVADLPACRLRRTGELIKLRPAPDIILTERLDRSDAEKLMRQGKWKCNRGTTHFTGADCFCWEHGGFLPKELQYQAEYDALPEPEKKKAKQKALGYEKIKQSLVEGKSIEGLSYEEELKARAEGGELRAQAIIAGRYEEHLVEKENRESTQDEYNN